MPRQQGACAAEIGEKAIWIDERAPNVTLTQRHHSGWEGPVATANGTVEERREYAYAAGPLLNGDNVFVGRGGVPLPPAYRPRPVVGTVRFTAPPGYVVCDAERAGASAAQKFDASLAETRTSTSRHRGASTSRPRA